MNLWTRGLRANGPRRPAGEVMRGVELGERGGGAPASPVMPTVRAAADRLPGGAGRPFATPGASLVSLLLIAGARGAGGPTGLAHVFSS